MNFNNVRVPNVPGGGGAAWALTRAIVLGGLGLYGALNSLYNVEGGHRAIVFNRIVGVKDKVPTIPGFTSLFVFVFLFEDAELM
jgi:prohibitin 2